MTLGVVIACTAHTRDRALLLRTQGRQRGRYALWLAKRTADATWTGEPFGNTEKPRLGPDDDITGGHATSRQQGSISVQPTEHDATTPGTQPPRRMGRGLFWAMLAVIVVLAGTSAVAMSGWSTAISRADEQTSRASALRMTADQVDGLRQKVADVQKELTDAQAREGALRTQLADSKASLAAAEGKFAAADDRAKAAENAAADAEQARGQLQAKPDATPSAVARNAGPVAAPQTASNISAESARSTIAPELPLPGLPPGATPRDYLVAAQQAVREGRSGRAQAALERAETRLLNQASLAGEPERPASHAGISEIEHALDQLGNGDTDAALQTINGLLARH